MEEIKERGMYTIRGITPLNDFSLRTDVNEVIDTS
ncbi:hypothetical protein PAV_1c04420 [Paenibacillus alvei DSM 29]|nr:hypothetical protein PAV_1c04420 [Paenibacillus alvei DSM 29]